MSNWETFTVDETVRKIDSSEWQLPVIQRDFVWPKDKITLLFDTILKKDPFGGVMAYVEESGTTPLFAHRQFSKNGNTNESHTDNGKISTDRIIIIDGQQRLQSMYIALRGDYHGELFYFNVYNPSDADEFDFEFSKNPSDLPGERTFDNGESFVCKWVSVRSLIEEWQKRHEPEKVCKNLFVQYEITNENLKDVVRLNINSFCTAIFNQKAVGVAKLYLDQDETEISRRIRMVELFRRLNDGGTRLSGVDLIASQIKAYDWNMEATLRRINDEYSDIGFDSDSIIKLSLIVNGKPKAELSEFTEDDAAFFTKNFVRIEACIIGYSLFLKASGFFALIKNRKTRIPGYIIANYLFRSPLTEDQIKSHFDNFDTKNLDFSRIKKWLSLSLLNRFFSRGCGWKPEKTGLDRLSSVIAKTKKRLFPLDELIHCYQSYPRLTLILPSQKLSASYFDRDVVFQILYGDKYALRTEDIDHIQPRSLVSDQFPDLTHRTENLQLIDFKTNREIKRAKPFQEWFDSSVSEDMKKPFLERHFIPQDRNLWKVENFKEFVSKRNEMIQSKLIESTE